MLPAFFSAWMRFRRIHALSTVKSFQDKSATESDRVRTESYMKWKMGFS